MNIYSYIVMYLSTHLLYTLGISQMKSTQWLLLSTHVSTLHYLPQKLYTFKIQKKQIQAMVEKPLRVSSFMMAKEKR